MSKKLVCFFSGSLSKRDKINSFLDDMMAIPGDTKVNISIFAEDVSNSDKLMFRSVDVSKEAIDLMDPNGTEYHFDFVKNEFSMNGKSIHLTRNERIAIFYYLHGHEVPGLSATIRNARTRIGLQFLSGVLPNKRKNEEN